MTGEQVREGLQDGARKLGYLAHHETDSRLSPSGFPDLLIAGYGQTIAVECKGQTEPFRMGSVTRKGDRYPGQVEWLMTLAQCGTMTFVCRPKSPNNPSELTVDRFLGKYIEIGYHDMLDVLNENRTAWMERQGL